MKIQILALIFVATTVLADVPSHIFIEKKVTHEIAKSEPAKKETPPPAQKPCVEGLIDLYLGGNYHRTKLDATGLGIFNGNLMGAQGGFTYRRDWGLYANIEVVVELEGSMDATLAITLTRQRSSMCSALVIMLTGATSCVLASLPMLDTATCGSMKTARSWATKF